MVLIFKNERRMKINRERDQLQKTFDLIINGHILACNTLKESSRTSPGNRVNVIVGLSEINVAQ